MREERRHEPKRMGIQKPIELLTKEGRLLGSGTTDNLSDAGVGAALNAVPVEDQEVLLRIFWDSERAPIEQPARVIWSDSDIGGGARVGLSVGQEPVDPRSGSARASGPESPALTVETAAAHTAFLEIGSPVVMSSHGVAVEAVVADIGDIGPDNRVQLVLEITDSAFTDPAAVDAGSGELAEDQDWTPHPFRDAWFKVARFAGPVLTVLLALVRQVASVTAKLVTAFWRVVPEPFKGKVRAFRNKLRTGA